MAVRRTRTLQRLPSEVHAVVESGSGMIGHITLDTNCAGARSAGKLHAACDVAGAGNGATDDPTRARREKSRTQPRGVLRATAPVLDPTRSRVTGVPTANTTLEPDQFRARRSVPQASTHSLTRRTYVNGLVCSILPSIFLKRRRRSPKQDVQKGWFRRSSKPSSIRTINEALFTQGVFLRGIPIWVRELTHFRSCDSSLFRFGVTLRSSPRL